MKNKSLIFSLLISTITIRIGILQCSMHDDEDKREVLSCCMDLDRIGFSGLLSGLQDQEIVFEVADRFLKNLLMHYSARSASVHPDEYQRALNHMRNFFSGHLFGLLGVFKPTHEQRAYILAHVKEEAISYWITQACLKSPFDIVMSAYDGEVLDLLLNNGADLETPGGNDRMRPLHSAVALQKRSYFDCLLEIPVDVDARDASQRTPLHLAVESGNFYFVKALWFAGARFDVQDDRGYTPLRQAVINQRKSMLYYLLALGITVPYRIQRKLADFKHFRYKNRIERHREEVINQLYRYAVDANVELPEQVFACISQFVVSYLEPEEVYNVDDDESDSDEYFMGISGPVLDVFTLLVRPA